MKSGSSTLARRSGLAAIVGATLWAGSVGAELVHGVEDGSAAAWSVRAGSPRSPPPFWRSRRPPTLITTSACSSSSARGSRSAALC